MQGDINANTILKVVLSDFGCNIDYINEKITNGEASYVTYGQLYLKICYNLASENSKKNNVGVS